MANRQIKRAKDDLLEEKIRVTQPGHFIKRVLTLIFTMARLSPFPLPPGRDLPLRSDWIELREEALLMMINKTPPKVNPALKTATSRIPIEIRPKIIYVDSI